MQTGDNKFFSVALFKQDVLVICSKKGLKKFIKANGGMDEEMLLDAWQTSNAFVYKCNVNCRPWLAICMVNKSSAAACHESVHAARAIMSNADITVSDDTEELLAYLTEYIFAQTCIIAGIE